ncbi:MAG TPA: patatin family protein [Lachnospiraceae bacterium]|nr:patatin family protein [Lachnospiraceae bacterium]
MTGIVLEGGTFRPVFSAGVMDALLSENILLPYCIGVSAGISNGFSYISKQPQRNLEIMQKYRNDKRYMSRSNLRKYKSVFGLDFVFDEIPNKLIPFDKETFFSYEGKCLVGVTNVETGQPEYKDAMEADDKFTMLRATCALPMFFPAIEMDGNKYYDGGLSDPIPVQKALDDGCDKVLIVLTQPRGFVKRFGKYDKLGARVLGRRYPEIRRAIMERPERYNEVVKFCAELVKEKKAIIIRPNHLLNSFESDVRKLEMSYWHGYRMTKEKMKRMKKFLGISQD